MTNAGVIARTTAKIDELLGSVFAFAAVIDVAWPKSFRRGKDAFNLRPRDLSRRRRMPSIGVTGRQKATVTRKTLGRGICPVSTRSRKTRRCDSRLPQRWHILMDR
jgi:hypothetical protein